jgi:hypothetical protein
MKNTTIEFYRKEVYGLEKKYVVDPKLAETIQTLTGRKTLLDSDIKALTTLGFTFKEVLKPTE